MSKYPIWPFSCILYYLIYSMEGTLLLFSDFWAEELLAFQRRLLPLTIVHPFGYHFSSVSRFSYHFRALNFKTTSMEGFIMSF